MITISHTMTMDMDMTLDWQMKTPQNASWFVFPDSLKDYMLA